ncbi:MAG TPA: hypothetical protein VKY74_05775 [Chloroflexia bacterium]|nr:hypothetical protein [Chloroflexia bacterium]
MSDPAHALSHLEIAGLIRRAATEPDLEYLFRHALVQDAAYWSLLRADRCRLHATIGAILEDAYVGRRAEIAPLLAHHFAQAGDRPRAGKYFILAADQALAAYANHEAAQHYRAALALRPEGGARAPVLAGLGEALARQGHHAPAIATWREAISLYTALGNFDTVARLYARAGRVTWFAGDSLGSLALCRAGLATIPEDLETAGRAALLHETARALVYNGLAAESAPLARQAFTLAEQLGDPEIQAEALITWAVSARQPLAERIAMMERAVALAEGAGRLSTAVRAHNNLGVFLEDRRAAREHQRRGAALARRAGLTDQEFGCRTNACHISLQLGDFAAVEADLPPLRAILDPANKKRVQQVWFVEGVLWHDQGAWAAAEERLRAAQALAVEIGNLRVVADTNMELADLLIEQGAWAVAAPLVEETIALAGQVGYDPVEPYGLLILIHAHEGRLADAQRLLAEIRALAAADPHRDEKLAAAVAALAVAQAHWDAAWAAFAVQAAAEARQEARWSHARTLTNWAAAHLARGAPEDHAAARALLHEARALYESWPVPPYVARVDALLAQVAR